MRLRLTNGEKVDARIKGKKTKPVCGDVVSYQQIDNESEVLITGISERRNELTRPNLRGRIDVLAANVDVLVVVAAVAPLPDWYIVDRYLSAAEFMRVDSIVVFNKVELLGEHGLDIPELDEYRDIGIEVVECSAHAAIGLDSLRSLLEDRCAIVVGQSGVGKSSLINELATDSSQRTAGISSKTSEGKHTTVNSVMLTLTGGGSIIDSPGVRDYTPGLTELTDVAEGFREICSAAGDCRFANCRHLREPGCAVKAGVDNGEIAERRYESYKRLVNIRNQLTAGR